MTATNKVEIIQEASNIEGLDKIFETDAITAIDRDNSDNCPTPLPNTSDKLPDLTPEEAAQVLGKSARTIRRMLEKGSLTGYKINGKKRDEWRIPAGEVSDISDLVTVTKSVTDHDDDRLVLELRSRIDQLESKLEGAQREIQAAAFRNGYLESQTELKDQQIKLLTDSQHKIGWWAKFSSWFFKAQ